MEEPFELSFSDELSARAVRVSHSTELTVALRQMSLPGPMPALVLVGGASRQSSTDLTRLRSLFSKALAPAVETVGAAVIDGGTDAGVVQLMGQARAEGRHSFPLIGLAVESLVTWPGGPRQEKRVELEPHHTHFILVPGFDWGDESPWISQLATVLSGESPSVTVLVNGGEIAWKDVGQSIKDGRSVIVVGGSGRTANVIADTQSGKASDRRAKEIVSSGLLQVVDLQDLDSLSNAVRNILAVK